MRLGIAFGYLCAILMVKQYSALFVNGDQGYWILGLKSVWHGFNRGFYKRSGKTVLSDGCIDETTLNHYFNAVAIWKGDDSARGDYVTSIGDIAHVVANICDCEFKQPILDLIQTCTRET